MNCERQLPAAGRLVEAKRSQFTLYVDSSSSVSIFVLVLICWVVCTVDIDFKHPEKIGLPNTDTNLKYGHDAIGCHLCLGVKASDLRNDPWWPKTRMMGLSDGERISMIRSTVLIYNTRVWQTDGRTELAWHIRTTAIQYAVARNNCRKTRSSAIAEKPCVRRESMPRIAEMDVEMTT